MQGITLSHSKYTHNGVFIPPDPQRCAGKARIFQNPETILPRSVEIGRIKVALALDVVQQKRHVLRRRFPARHKITVLID
jgi:hypothetical protein